MKRWVSRRVGFGLLAVGWLFSHVPAASGFALLGPFAPWMKPSLGYHCWDDIGGPMNLGEEYRWTVPVLSYGFDQSFIEAFGQPGVDAVEQAIQILNDLPPASGVELTNYPFYTTEVNYYAGSQALFDLKSATLALLCEQLGLAKPTRYTWTLGPNSLVWLGDLVNSFLDEATLCNPELHWTNYLYRRNIDPQTLRPSPFVNSAIYTFYVNIGGMPLQRAEAVELLVDTVAYPLFSAVSEQYLDLGCFYTGLTADDAGGLLYLLARTNVNVETLDDTAIAADGSTQTLVRTAPRPGIEKITFTRHPTDAAGGFTIVTNCYDDSFFTNGTLATQQVCRIVKRPDILFRADDLGVILYTPDPSTAHVGFSNQWHRSDTARWVNNAALNNNPGGDGPGVIRGPVEITFHTPGRYLAATGGSTTTDSLHFWNWAGLTSTNVTFFPSTHTNLTSLTLRTRTFLTNSTPTFEWTVLGRPGGNYQIDIATNVTEWQPLATVSNAGGVFQFRHPVTGPRQFFRAVLVE